MVRKMRRDPLDKRLPRELKSDLGKYAVIFIMLVLFIGLMSGYLVADESMIKAYNDSFEKYNVEDGHFEAQRRLTRVQASDVQALGLTLYENFYIDREFGNGTTIRLFKKRTDVNLECLMDGEFPGGTDEIAIDRMYADNNDIHIGDILDGLKVTGLVALSDYSTLFSDNDDSMFDAKAFGVAVITEEAFAQYPQTSVVWDYAWKDEEVPAGSEGEKERNDELVKELSRIVPLEEFLPRYQNQAITFTGNDFSRDQAMMKILMYILIAIVAFIFAVTTANTISQEASAIGTLRASGYTRGELVRHYMKMPLLVTLIGAAIGNVLGYTWFKDFCAGLYYGSYSLPTYVTIWSVNAFINTTVVPVIMVAVIVCLMLWHSLRLSPLKFLRHDLRSRRQKRALPLSAKIPFFTRFRLRVILQNLSSYFIIFLGLMFADVLLIFGLQLPIVLHHYQDTLKENMLCRYQYILSAPISLENDSDPIGQLVDMLLFSTGVETEEPDAEKFSAWSLQTQFEGLRTEEVLLYGVEEDSRYIRCDFEEGDVYISSAFAKKYSLAVGDSFRLAEKYAEDTYDFVITGIYPYDSALCVFMDKEEMNELFGLAKDTFAGYFSDTEITDIDEKYIGQVIDYDSLTKISRQLDISMDGMMDMVTWIAVLIFMAIVYLLSKTIIEKNAQSISMTKILGYTDREISSLYIISTSIIVVLFLLAALPVAERIMHFLYAYYLMREISGFLPYYFHIRIFIQMFLMGLAGYLAVALLEFRRIRKVPMGEALKNVE